MSFVKLTPAQVSEVLSELWSVGLKKNGAKLFYKCYIQQSQAVFLGM